MFVALIGKILFDILERMLNKTAFIWSKSSKIVSRFG